MSTQGQTFFPQGMFYFDVPKVYNPLKLLGVTCCGMHQDTRYTLQLNIITFLFITSTGHCIHIAEKHTLTEGLN